MERCLLRLGSLEVELSTVNVGLNIMLTMLELGIDPTENWALSVFDPYGEYIYLLNTETWTYDQVEFIEYPTSFVPSVVPLEVPIGSEA